MASGANPFARLRTALLVMLCLLAVTLGTVPCAMALPVAPAAHAPAMAMDCSDCCGGQTTVACAPLCCGSHSQPAETATVQVPDGLETAALAHESVQTFGSASLRVAMTILYVPPPLLLHPILRI